MKKEFKPIAMKCTEEQFDAIKPILEANGCTIFLVESFKYQQYLVNNLDGEINRISNLNECDKDKNGRTVFEEWNQDIFLEYCGIEVKPEFRPIAMKCNQRQFIAIDPILKENGLEVYNITNFTYAPYLVNNVGEDDLCVSNVATNSKDNHDRTVFEEWNQNIFLEYCGIKLEKQTEKTMGYKLTVPTTDVLEIHKIACSTWKKIIAKYLTRVDSEQNIKFTEQEIDDMFIAATAEQKPVLTRIFGEKKKEEIDYTKLKTGSKVIIKYSGHHCGGIGNINRDEPVDIVFYKTPHFISGAGRFTTIGHYDQYITFHQKGEFVLFTAHEEIDYIKEVIEY